MLGSYWQGKTGILLQNLFIPHIQYRILPNWQKLFSKKNPKTKKPNKQQRTPEKKTLKMSKKPQTPPNPKERTAFSVYRKGGRAFEKCEPQTLTRMACRVWHLEVASCGVQWACQLSCHYPGYGFVPSQFLRAQAEASWRFGCSAWLEQGQGIRAV